MAKPPRTAANPAARQSRRAVIAKGVIEQKPVTTIAAELGVTRRTVHNELRAPETQALIQAWMKPHHERLQRIVDRSIAQVERALTLDEEPRLKRIEWLSDRIERMRKVIEERSEDGAAMAVAGGKTGLIVHQERVIGSGDNARFIDEYEVDTGLLKELREHERQLREELNDFGPNLKAVERARDLLEMAEGTKKDGDSGDARFRRGQFELVELLEMYAKFPVTTPEA